VLLAGFVVVNFALPRALVGVVVKLESVEIVDDFVDGVDLPDCDCDCNCELAAFASAFDSELFGAMFCLSLTLAVVWARALAPTFGSFNGIVIGAVALSLPESVPVAVPAPLRFFFFFFFFLALRGVALFEDASESGVLGVRGVGFLILACLGVFNFVSDGDLSVCCCCCFMGVVGAIGVVNSETVSPVAVTAAAPSPSPLPSAMSGLRLTVDCAVESAT